jgi:hypothetical protein
MDTKIASAQYAIGEASNIAQLALSYYYDSEDDNRKKELEDVFIICSVLAQCSIDSAKRQFKVDVNNELSRLSKLPCMQQDDGKKYPLFYANVQKKKNSKKLGSGVEINIKEDKIRKFNCPMDKLADIIDANVIDLRQHKNLNPYPFTYALNEIFTYEKGNKKQRDSKQYKKILSFVREFDEEAKKLDVAMEDYPEKLGILFDNCMTKMRNIHINEHTMHSLIAYAFFKNQGEQKRICDRLLTVLYDKDKDMFLKMFKKTNKSSDASVKMYSK